MLPTRSAANIASVMLGFKEVFLAEFFLSLEGEMDLKSVGLALLPTGLVSRLNTTAGFVPVGEVSLLADITCGVGVSFLAAEILKKFIYMDKEREVHFLL